MEETLPTDVELPRSLQVENLADEEMLDYVIRKTSVVFQEIPTPHKSDPRWSTGVNRNNKSRTYRVVAPLWYWEEIFRNADLPHFFYMAECGWSGSYLSFLTSKSSLYVPVGWYR